MCGLPLNGLPPKGRESGCGSPLRSDGSTGWWIEKEDSIFSLSEDRGVWGVSEQGRRQPEYVRLPLRGPRARFRSGPGRTLKLVGSTFLVVAALASCSSSPKSSALVGGQQGCTAVADVLSDGPDPDVDPVGYAQAQVRPLEQLQISDVGLSKAVKNLAAAFSAASSTMGGQHRERGCSSLLGAARAQRHLSRSCVM